MPSTRLPGISQEESIALWTGFVKRTLTTTGFKTTFKGKTRNVYRHGEYLAVLDEYHGQLELLEFRRTAGKTRHLGIQMLKTLYYLPEGQGAAKVVTVEFGEVRLTPSHQPYILTGSL